MTDSIMYIQKQRSKKRFCTTMSQDDETERRKLPNLPSFKYDQLTRFESIHLGLGKTERQNSLLRFSSNNRQASRITEDIVNIIRSAEAEETRRQVKMASVQRKENFGCNFERTASSKHNIAVIQGSTQRIAGIIDLYQDSDGCWIRKIEITKVPGQGLGFFIKKGNGFDRKNGVFISRVSLGSILDINGLLHSGDEVLEVNRVHLRGFPLKDVALMMQIPDKLLLTTRSHIPVNTREMTWGKLPIKGVGHDLSNRTSREIDQNHNFEQHLVKSLTYSSTKSTKSFNGENKGNTELPKKPQINEIPKEQNRAMNDAKGEQTVAVKRFETADADSMRSSGSRALPDVPVTNVKSPRRLPSPPLTADNDSLSGASGSMSPASRTEREDAFSTSSSGLRRAELYRVQTPDQPTPFSEIPPADVTAQLTEELCQPTLHNLNQQQGLQGAQKSPPRTSTPEKDFRRVCSVADTPKNSNRLGFFRSLSSKDVKRDNKNEIGIDRFFEPYKSENLNSEMDFTRAFSGMLAVHIVKIENMQAKSSKEKKCYCTIEVDDEFQASTSKKKLESSSNVIQFDEQFDIEISHASEVTIYIFSIGSGKQHSLASSGVIFLERILNKTTSRSVALELESTGVIYLSLDFTEARKFLKRTPSSRKSGVFGFNIISTLDDEKNTIPIIVRKCVEEIEARGMHIVGLYRISGNAKKKKILKAEFDQDSSSVNVSEKNGVDCNVLTGILKDYLRELPEPLIPEEVFNKINNTRAANASPDLSKRQRIFSELLRLLHYGSRATLIYIMDHLIRVEENKEVNKMDLTNLAVCFGPVLLCPPSTNAVLDFKRIIEALEFLLKIWPKKHEQGVEIEITNM